MTAILFYQIGKNNVKPIERVIVVREVHNPASDSLDVKMEEMHDIVSHADSIISIEASDSTINEALQWIRNR